MRNFQTDSAELREVLAGLQLQAKALNNQTRSLQGRADAQKRDLTAAESSNLDAWMAKFDAIEQEIVRVKDELAAAEIEAADRTPRGRQVPSAAIGARPESVGAHSHASAPAISARFDSMFPGATRSTPREFNNLGDFARAVLHRDPRLFNAASGMGEAVGADGGFYVPTGFFAGLMDDSLQAEAVRPSATIIPMTSGTISIPMFNLSNRSTGIATLEGKVTGEGTTGTTQKAAVREVSLTARKVSVLVPTTTELLQDAPQLFGQMLRDAMTEALGQTLDSWFIGGTGSGVPQGILTAPCTVSVAKDGSQVAATLTPTNISGMVARLAPGSWARAQWIVSPSALAQLFTLATVIKNVAGTENVGGTNHDFFQVLPDGKFSLLGRPLIVSDRCQALGTKGDIMLVDLKSYLVGIRQEAELLVDTSIGFKESEIWFRLNCRVDGQPALAAAITPRVGSATLSPFVTLDTRS